MTSRFVTDPRKLAGKRIAADTRDFRKGIAYSDHKVAYALAAASGKDVLDLGCVSHDPENYRSPFWVHKALMTRANSVTGMDLSAEGVQFLRDLGFNVI